MQQFRIGEKVHIMREATIEKIEQDTNGVRLQLRYQKGGEGNGYSIGHGYAIVDAEIVEKSLRGSHVQG